MKEIPLRKRRKESNFKLYRDNQGNKNSKKKKK
jgi:hypothetical protein